MAIVKEVSCKQYKTYRSRFRVVQSFIAIIKNVNHMNLETSTVSNMFTKTLASSSGLIIMITLRTFKLSVVCGLLFYPLSFEFSDKCKRYWKDQVIRETLKLWKTHSRSWKLHTHHMQLKTLKYAPLWQLPFKVSSFVLPQLRYESWNNSII